MDRLASELADLMSDSDHSEKPGLGVLGERLECPFSRQSNG